MDYDEKFPEPPELKKQNIPPLKKQLRLIVILFSIAFIIALIFAITFYFHDKR